MNPEDYFSPHPVFHTFFGFDSPSVGTFFQGKSSHPIFHIFLWFERKVFWKNFLTLYSTLFSDFTTRRRKLFFRESPLTLYSTLFSRLDEKISNFFCRKTVGTLSSLIIESKNIFCEIFFRTKKKQKKKTGSADSRRRTREAIRGATEKRAFSLLFFFCFSIYSFSCIVHIGGSWWTHPWFTWYKHYPLGCRDIDFFVCTPDTRETPANRRKIRLFCGILRMADTPIPQIYACLTHCLLLTDMRKKTSKCGQNARKCGRLCRPLWIRQGVWRTAFLPLENRPLKILVKSIL